MPDYTYLPSRDADLLGFAENFSTKIAAAPTSFGLTALQATAFATLYDNFADAMRTLQDPTTKSPPFVATKNTAKQALINGPGGIRQLVALVQAHPGITPTQLIDLRLTVRDVEPTPVPPPSSAPTVTVLNNAGRQVTLRVYDAKEENRRGKPEGITGATVFTYVGEEPPANITLWQFNQSTTKPNRVTIMFPESVPDGAKVWIAAFWYNPTAQSGPLSEPISTRVIGGLVKQAA
jgi:hypothetical protein